MDSILYYFHHHGDVYFFFVCLCFNYLFYYDIRFLFVMPYLLFLLYIYKRKITNIYIILTLYQFRMSFDKIMFIFFFYIIYIWCWIVIFFLICLCYIYMESTILSFFAWINNNCNIYIFSIVMNAFTPSLTWLYYYVFIFYFSYN